jgi:hypothetical protein
VPSAELSTWYSLRSNGLDGPEVNLKFGYVTIIEVSFMSDMKRIECATEGCHSFYDGEDYGVEVIWHCLKCQRPESRLFDRTKKMRQDVLRSESTDRTRVRYWMRWLREQA